MIVQLSVEQLARRDAWPSGGFWVELFGVSEPMHDHHAPGFRQLVLGLRRARAERVPFSVVYRLTRSNYRHASEMVRVAHTLGARAVGFAPAAPELHVPAPLPELVAPFIERAFQAGRAWGMPVATHDRVEPTAAAEWLPDL
ncbi:MAG: hypothetical protein IT377_06455 [Polyangiaceae bacterium]|nr:hypothetical protein [Polyangiaceae bacterium]